MQLMNKVDPTTGVGACSVGSGGVWGDWLLHRVLAISTNPGGGTHGQTMASGFHQEQSHWHHHSAGSSQLRRKPFYGCSSYGCGSDATHHLNCKGQAPTGTTGLEGWTCVQARVTGAATSSVSFAFTISSASSDFTTSSGGVGSIATHGDSLAFSSSPGRHAEG